MAVFEAVWAGLSLKRHVIQMLAGSILAQISSVALYWYCARSFGPDEFGSIVGLTTVALFLSVASNAGSAPQLTQGLASGDMPPEVFARLLWRRVGSAAVLGLMVLAYGAANQDPWGESAWAALLVPSSVLAQNAAVVPRAVSRFSLAAAATSVDKALALVVAIVLTRLLSIGPQALPLALTLGALAGAAIVVSASEARRRYFLPTMGHVFVRVPASAKSGWYRSAGLLLAIQSLDVVALRGLGGASIAGEYAAVSKWGQPMSMILAATNQVALTNVAREKDATAALKAVRRTWPVVSIVIAVAGVVALTADSFVSLLLGPAYPNSGVVLRMMMIGSMLSACSQSLLTYFFGRGSPAKITQAFAIGVLAQFVLILLLVPRIGAEGGAVAWVVGQLAILSGLGVSFLRGRSQSRLGRLEASRVESPGSPDGSFADQDRGGV